MSLTFEIKIAGRGSMKGELYPEIAPNTVKNFVWLANAKHFYDGLIFHRVISGFMIQGGCPEGRGTGGPGYHIPGEFRINGFQNDLKHSRGVLSMARAGHPDSAGSQFFLMHADAPHLDGQYAGFGKLTEGFELLDELASAQTDFRDRPLEDLRIESIRCFGEGTENPEEPKKA